jgi:hypothetical protein
MARERSKKREKKRNGMKRIEKKNRRKEGKIKMLSFSQVTRRR